MTAFADVSELRTGVLAWLARTPDDEDAVVDVVNQFIALAEQRIAQTLRVREMQERVLATLDEMEEAIPSRFIEPIACNIEDTTGRWRPLKFISENELNRYWRYEGVPVHYTITGGQLRFGPFIKFDEDVTAFPNVELLFFAAPKSLDETNPTNDILQHYPSLYLYGSLVEAAGFILSDDVERYGGFYEKALADANGTGVDAMYEGPSRATASVQVA